MQVAQVRLLRRFLIGLIVVVSLAVLVNYFQGRLHRASRKPEAQILSPEILRSAENLERTANKNGVTRFRLRAVKLLETRQGKEYLQGIEAVDLNADGSVNNQMTSQTGWYDPALKQVYFSGDVRLSLGKDITLRMGSLHYDHGVQTGYSEDRIQLVSPQVSGTAKGFRYDNARKNLELLHELDFVLHRPVGKPDGSVQIEDYHLSAQHGFYLETELAIRLEGAARLVSTAGTLGGDRIEATFTADRKRLTNLACQGNAIYRSIAQSEDRTIQGERIEFGIGRTAKELESIRVLDKASFLHKSPSGELKLTASEIQMELDPAESVPKLIRSRSNVRFELARSSQTTAVAGESLVATFVVGTSALESIQVHDHASMSMGGRDAGSGELQAEDIRISFRNLDGRSMPRELQAVESVRWQLPGRIGGSAGEAASSLSASNLQMRYSQTGEWLESGTAFGGVTLATIPKADGQSAALRRLQSDRIDFGFYAGDNRPQSLIGEGHVQVLYQKAGASGAKAAVEELRTSSSSIRAQFRREDGSAETVTQSGNFIYQDGTRTAKSGNCEFTAATEMLTLRENPSVSDAEISTSGKVIEFDLKQKILAVRQHVQSILKSSREKSQGPLTSAGEASSPSIITADEMLYWTEPGRIRYSGTLNLLSASSHLQADSLEILDRGERIEAQGNIKHLILDFGDANRQKPDTDAESKVTRANEKIKGGNQALIRSTRLQYSRSANRIHYEGSVFLDSASAKLRADSMDVFLDSSGRKVERGKAQGNLIITQPTREVRGAEAEYFLTEGKFVVTGDPAELREYAKGTTRAPRLTFYTADDRIVSGIR